VFAPGILCKYVLGLSTDEMEVITSPPFNSRKYKFNEVGVYVYDPSVF
jgi:hypothetical protein